MHFKEVNSAVEFTNGDRVDVAYASKSSGALKIARFEWGVGISDNHLEYVKKQHLLNHETEGFHR